MTAITDIEAKVPLYNGKRCTYTESFALENDGFQYQIIDGVMIVTPASYESHQNLSLEIVTELNIFLRQHPVGSISYAPRDVKLNEKTTYQPDILYISNERKHIRKPQYVDGAPDLVIEIVSPGTRSMDTDTKFKDYEKFGVKEYWIMEPKNVMLSKFYCLEEERYKEFIPEESMLHSKVLNGFVLNLLSLKQQLETV